MSALSARVVSDWDLLLLPVSRLCWSGDLRPETPHRQTVLSLLFDEGQFE
eukprot:COSAG01_NODE_3392_length_6150_cov_6.923814_5_plen_50_part_00